MISTHESEVASRFDALHGRFKPTVAGDDYRLRAVVEAVGPLRGMEILDLGCGKGRFARSLQAEGVNVAGVDLSVAMLAEATGIDRVRASARRLPFRPSAFDAAIAIEVFEHLPWTLRRSALAEARRVLRPGGVIVIVDKNIASLNVHRPWLPSFAVKRLDEYRGRWMYPRGSSVREHWFWPAAFRRELRRFFADVRMVHLLSPAEGAKRLFRYVPAARLMTLWVGRVPGGCHV
jgi:2-polyprenyl-6-hydroxyphenyl methylase/3-demethylubiquinone-9 3-methyltransferase